MDETAWRERDSSNKKKEAELFKGNKKAQNLTGTGAGRVFHMQIYSHNLFTVQQHHTGNNLPKT